ncbi:MAG: M55 family metallopeptidase [Chloroflexota bacterium]
MLICRLDHISKETDMDVYIIVDMEGISGVTDGRMIRTGHQQWVSRGRGLMTAEVNACIEGVLAAGAQRIWVKDGHDSGENILREQLQPAAELISGSTASGMGGLIPGIESGFDVLILLGFHAKMGTLNAHFDHTISTATISEIRFNETAVGEIGIYGAFAGHFGVPTVMVAGDVAATKEAIALFGENIQTVAVKQGLGRFSTRTLSPEETHPLIREAAKASLSTTVAPWRLDAPFNVEVDFLRSAEADMAALVPGSQRVGARTVAYTHDDPEMTFQAMQAMVNLGGIAASRWARNLYTTGAPVT